MKLSAKHVIQNRERVLDAALSLFRKRGIDRVSVADLMREAGLTHGGFYNHFESKTDLAGQACARAFAVAAEQLGTERKSLAPGRLTGLRGYVARYLSRSWRDADAAHCPMVSFASDAAREPDSVGAPFAVGLRAYIDELAHQIDGGDEEERRHQAISVAATLVGALTLARSVREGDPALSDAILESARDDLLARLPEHPAG